jgi:hypothetical protein
VRGPAARGRARRAHTGVVAAGQGREREEGEEARVCL